MGTGSWPRRVSGGVLLIGALCVSAPMKAAPAQAVVAEAAQQGDEAMVRAALEQGADVNVAQGDGMTALHWAGLRDEADVARMLLAAGADVNATTRLNGHTPLLLAAEEGRAAVLTPLLQAGADVNARTANGTSALMFAAGAGNLEAVNTLLTHGAEVNASEFVMGLTPAAFAAAAGRATVVLALAKHGADVNAPTKVIDVANLNMDEAGAAFEGGAAVRDDTVRDDTVRDDTVRDDTVRDDTVRDDTVRDDTVRDDTVRDDTVRDDTVRDDTVRDDTVRDDTVRDDTVRDDTVRDDTVRDDTVRDDTVRDDTVRDDTVRDDTVRDDTVRDDTVRDDTVRDDTVRDDTVRDDTVRDDTVRDDTVRDDTVRDDTVRDDTVRDDTVRDDTVRDDTVRDDTVRDDTVRDDTVRDDTVRDDTVRDDTVRDDTVRDDTPKPGIDRKYSMQEQVYAQGGMTPLLMAARQGHLEAMEALLHSGADVNQVSGGDGTSPLLIAIINGQFDLAMVLLARGADPTLAAESGVTPLYAALNCRWAPRVSYPQPNAYLNQQTTYLELLKELLDKGAEPNVRLKKSVWYFDHYLDYSGLVEIGATPFWRAAYAADVEGMKVLAAYGADPTIPTARPPGRRRAWFATRPIEDIEGAPPLSPVGGQAIPPIVAAAGTGYIWGLAAANVHRHAPAGQLAAVKYLVEELNVDVNARDEEGETALHNAAARGDVAMIRYLVVQGADVMGVTRRGATTADYANGPAPLIPPNPEALALLESLGSKNNQDCLSCVR